MEDQTVPRTASPYNIAEPTPEDMATVKAALDRANSGKGMNLADLPDDVAVMVRRLLEAYAAGRRPRVIPDEADISTFQAADILNVSRPHVIKLLDEGAMPFRLVGTHRRIRLADVLAYKAAKDRDSDMAMDELVAQAQELKLGY
jgi:excisionase family DNA binding protein